MEATCWQSNTESLTGLTKPLGAWMTGKEATEKQQGVTEGRVPEYWGRNEDIAEKP